MDGNLILAFVLTAESVGLASGLKWPSRLLILGAVTMPAVCYLSAFRDVFRHLFFIPAGAVTAAIATFLWRLVNP